MEQQDTNAQRKYPKPRTKKQIEADPRVVDLWQEQDGCFHPTRPSWWATLAPGWQWDDCTNVHEATLSDLADAIDAAVFVGVSS